MGWDGDRSLITGMGGKKWKRSQAPTPRGVERIFSMGGGGGVSNAIFQKGSICTDLFPNTLYRKCRKFVAPLLFRGTT